MLVMSELLHISLFQPFNGFDIFFTDTCSNYLYNLQGNFQALINFHVDSGDDNLKNYLENGPRNATKIIDVIKECIVDDLVAEVKDSGLYSISADEKADRSKH
jgi:hypothetical protein